MEKIAFTSEEMSETVEFFVLEQTKINGISYILVKDSDDSIYEIVEDDDELSAVSKVFEELLEDVDIDG